MEGGVGVWRTGIVGRGGVIAGGVRVWEEEEKAVCEEVLECVR